MADETKPTRTRRPVKRSCWWTAHLEGVSPHGDIVSRVKAMRSQQAWRLDAYKRWAEAYGEHVATLGREPEVWEEERLSINHLANLIDTLHAQTFKNRILPMGVTTAGDYEQTRRAQRLNRFFEGQFDEVHFHDELLLQLGLFVLVCGDGWLKTHRTGGRIRAEVVPSWDIYIDDTEARYGRPRTLFQTSLMDRYVLLEMFGREPDKPDPSLYGTAEERAELIEAASLDTSEASWVDVDYAGDQLLVTEAWHLRSGKDADDGRHAIVLDNGPMVGEPWTRGTFPFRWMKSSPTLTGVRGRSVVSQILPGQREHDKLSAKLQEAHCTVGVPRIVFQKGSNISLDHVNDEVGAFLHCDGPPPTAVNWEPIHASTYDYRSGIREEMSAEIGVSQYAAQSQIPAGMAGASGKALEVYEDTESTRHAALHRLLERFVLDVTDLFIDEAEALSEEEPDYAVLVAGKNTADELKWKDVRIDRDKLKLKISPVSALSKTPAAKFNQLMKLREAGEITSEEFRAGFEMPDIERMNGIAVSKLESIDQKIERMIYDGEYRNPTPFDDFALCIARGSDLYNYFDLQDVPDDRLAMVAQFVQRATELQAKASQPPPAPPGEEMLPPEMGGMPPPPGMGAPTMAGAEAGGAPPMVVS